MSVGVGDTTTAAAGGRGIATQRNSKRMAMAWAAHGQRMGNFESMCKVTHTRRISPHGHRIRGWWSVGAYFSLWELVMIAFGVCIVLYLFYYCLGGMDGWMDGRRGVYVAW